MKMNNKGFTMVELLVAMAIMGLLIIMAFPTIRAIQTNNTKTKYKEYGTSAISATKIYTDSYAEDLFDDEQDNEFKVVYFDELVRKDLIKDFDMKPNSVMFFIANKIKIIAQKYAGQIRQELGRKLDLIDQDRLELCIVKDLKILYIY